MKVCHGEGEGLVVYVGKRYLSVGFRGFAGWSSSKWMPGGWEFFSPHVGVGRVFSDAPSHYTYGRVLLPAKIVHLWRMRRPAYREGMRQVPRRKR